MVCRFSFLSRIFRKRRKYVLRTWYKFWGKNYASLTAASTSSHILCFSWDQSPGTSGTSAKLLGRERGFTPRGHNPLGRRPGHHPTRLQTLNHVTDATNRPLVSILSVPKKRATGKTWKSFQKQTSGVSRLEAIPSAGGIPFLYSASSRQTEPIGIYHWQGQSSLVNTYMPGISKSNGSLASTVYMHQPPPILIYFFCLLLFSSVFLPLYQV